MVWEGGGGGATVWSRRLVGEGRGDEGEYRQVEPRQKVQQAKYYGQSAGRLVGRERALSLRAVCGTKVDEVATDSS